jgi:alpha-ribazole phosphatase
LSRLFLVRHGDTELNSAERYWGSSDIRLSAAGFRQAERLRNRLAAEKIDAVYSSDLQRASATAELIASAHRLEVISCAELREIDFGEIEGLTFDEVSQLYPEVTSLWVERNPALEYPGGESIAGFDKRVSKFLARLEKHNEEETVLIVAHSGVLRTLICRLLGMEPEHKWQFRLDLASLSILSTYQHVAVLSLLNDVSHL